MIDKQLSGVVGACGRLLLARREVEAALRARDEALVAWWPGPDVPKLTAGTVVSGALLEAGWSREDVAMVGVSRPTVRTVLERRLRDAATPTAC